MRVVSVSMIARLIAGLLALALSGPVGMAVAADSEASVGDWALEAAMLGAQPPEEGSILVDAGSPAGEGARPALEPRPPAETPPVGLLATPTSRQLALATAEEFPDLAFANDTPAIPRSAPVQGADTVTLWIWGGAVAAVVLAVLLYRYGRRRRGRRRRRRRGTSAQASHRDRPRRGGATDDVPPASRTSAGHVPQAAGGSVGPTLGDKSDSAAGGRRRRRASAFGDSAAVGSMAPSAPGTAAVGQASADTEPEPEAPRSRRRRRRSSIFGSGAAVGSMPKGEAPTEPRKRRSRRR